MYYMDTPEVLNHEGLGYLLTSLCYFIIQGLRYKATYYSTVQTLRRQGKVTTFWLSSRADHVVIKQVKHSHEKRQRNGQDVTLILKRKRRHIHKYH